jgi:hypothetical protein
METNNRKPWTKPQLVVLVRGRPEEGVLLACKNHPTPPGPAGGPCTNHCQTVAAS